MITPLGLSLGLPLGSEIAYDCKTYEMEMKMVAKGAPAVYDGASNGELRTLSVLMSIQHILLLFAHTTKHTGRFIIPSNGAGLSQSP